MANTISDELKNALTMGGSGDSQRLFGNVKSIYIPISGGPDRSNFIIAKLPPGALILESNLALSACAYNQEITLSNYSTISALTTVNIIAGAQPSDILHELSRTIYSQRADSGWANIPEIVNAKSQNDILPLLGTKVPIYLYAESVSYSDPVLVTIAVP